MRYYLFVFLFFLAACRDQQQESLPEIFADYTDHCLSLAYLKDADQQTDTFAQLSIKIPNRFDTLYQWNDHSCCSACGFLKYRFADSRYNQYAESGFFWSMIPDSVYQFTISHRPLRETPDSIELKQLTARDSFLLVQEAKHLYYQNNRIPLQFQFISAGGRGIYAGDFISPFGELTNDTTLYVIGVMNLKKCSLTFKGECGAKDTAGFREMVYKMIRSVRIDER